ncbi:MAG TPA: phospholipase D-like domain-containing protein, partial [Stenomitos sp.]
FMVKFEGPTLQDVYGKFEENWKLSGGGALRPVTLDLAPKGDRTLQVAVTSTSEREIRDSYLAAFKAAKDHIFINSPYFIDSDMVASLKDAAKRGVKVTAIVPSVGDNPAIDLMNRSVVNELLATGVKVYEYDTLNEDIGQHDHETDHFNHGKVATIDGKFTIIGTANMDRRSMALSQEINLNVDSEAFAKDVEERIFQHDLLTRAKPAQVSTMSAPTKAAEKILNAFRPLF